MTQKEKELLLQDLCSRLLYGVKIKDLSSQADTTIDVLGIKGHFVLVDEYNRFGNIYDSISIEYVKPYLRPMSSMTEEEKEEYTSYCFEQPFLQKDKTPNLGSVPMCIDWLNANHFDYRGLIPKGLAIAVTEENNPYK